MRGCGPHAEAAASLGPSSSFSTLHLSSSFSKLWAGVGLRGESPCLKLISTTQEQQYTLAQLPMLMLSPPLSSSWTPHGASAKPLYLILFNQISYLNKIVKDGI